MTGGGRVVRRWTVAERLYIAQKWGVETTKQIAAALARTEGAVRQRARRIVGTTVNKADDLEQAQKKPPAARPGV